MLLSLLRGYANATPGYRRGIPSGEYAQVQTAVYASTTFSSTSWRMHISPYTTSLQYTRSTDIHHARLIPRRGCRCDNRGLRSIPSDGRSVCIDNTPLKCTPEGVPELHTTVAWEAHIRTILDCKFIFITIRHYTHHHSA